MISVIIPTLNEKKNILKIGDELSKLKIVSEVIFIDDRSTDGTFNEIKKLTINKKFKGFSRRNKTRDLSQSVIYGIKRTKQKNILVMDCDLQHDTKDISNMWKIFKDTNADIVVGSRFMRKKFSGNLGFLRSIFSNLAIFFINFVFGKKSSDPLSGFFLCKKEHISKHENLFFAKGYKILFDILYNGNRNLNVKDLSILFKKRNLEKSKFNLRIIWIFLRQIFYTKFL